jgi:hypothetical protein
MVSQLHIAVFEQYLNGDFLSTVQGRAYAGLHALCASTGCEGEALTDKLSNLAERESHFFWLCGQDLPKSILRSRKAAVDIAREQFVGACFDFLSRLPGCEFSERVLHLAYIGAVDLGIEVLNTEMKIIKDVADNLEDALASDPAIAEDFAEIRKQFRDKGYVDFFRQHMASEEQSLRQNGYAHLIPDALHDGRYKENSSKLWYVQQSPGRIGSRMLDIQKFRKFRERLASEFEQENYRIRLCS